MISSLSSSPPTCQGHSRRAFSLGSRRCEIRGNSCRVHYDATEVRNTKFPSSSCSVFAMCKLTSRRNSQRMYSLRLSNPLMRANRPASSRRSWFIRTGITFPIGSLVESAARRDSSGIFYLFAKKVIGEPEARLGTSRLTYRGVLTGGPYHAASLVCFWIGKSAVTNSGQISHQSSGRRSRRVTAPSVARSIAGQNRMGTPRTRQLMTWFADAPILQANLPGPPHSLIASFKFAMKQTIHVTCDKIKHDVSLLLAPKHTIR